MSRTKERHFGSYSPDSNVGTKTVYHGIIRNGKTTGVVYKGRFISNKEYDRRLAQSKDATSKSKKTKLEISEEMLYPFFLLHAQIEFLKTVTL